MATARALLDRDISDPAATDSSIKDIIKAVSNLPHESLMTSI
jgi:hypothetical protein